MKYIFDSFGNKRKCFIGKDKFKKKNHSKIQLKVIFLKEILYQRLFMIKKICLKKFQKQNRQ